MCYFGFQVVSNFKTSSFSNPLLVQLGLSDIKNTYQDGFCYQQVGYFPSSRKLFSSNFRYWLSNQTNIRNLMV